MNQLGVYVHIPFCIKKCLYCDFNSYADKGRYKKEYINVLAGEIGSACFLSNYEIKSIFIGGGTPTCMDIGDISTILSKIKKHKILENAEITIEANPGTIDYIYLKELRQLGANRLSFGLQSASDRLLKILGRVHTYNDFLKSYDDAIKAGFENINVDLMFALPGQSLADWQDTLCKVSDLGATHISAYSLIIEDGAAFSSLYKKGELILPGEEEDRDMYFSAKYFLESKGYKLYEISNFAKKGYESGHNKIYWNCEEYAGFGLGAHSYINNKRYSNTEDFFKYLKDENKIVFEEILSQEESMEEFIFLGLRMACGIEIDKFGKKFGKGLFEVYGDKLINLISEGYISKNGGRIQLTEKGVYVSNTIFSELLC
ncbi:MAG: radical SAM family heme chaperone HemW [Clostridiales bacterium]|jgi:oxygen-independent coproporphyrinogen-3 oxidase|nr:radical SAM family heme chaperone HemW [Clostridiales bacterium]